MKSSGIPVSFFSMVDIQLSLESIQMMMMMMMHDDA